MTVLEAADRVGGRIDGTPFAGVEHVESGADAFLARVPDATDLARDVGLADELVVTGAGLGAAVWYDGLHRIPDGLLLGLPGRLTPLATTRCSPGAGSCAPRSSRCCRGRRSTTTRSATSCGRGSATRCTSASSTRWSAASTPPTPTASASAEVPQLYDLASQERSLLLGPRRTGRRGRGDRQRPHRSSPPHAAGSRSWPQRPPGHRRCGRDGAHSDVGRSVAVRPVHTMRGGCVDGERFDAVIVATPARARRYPARRSGPRRGDDAAAAPSRPMS